MSARENDLARVAAELRRSFDATFAAPVATQSSTLTDVLAIRVGGDPFALQLSELFGVYADRRIVPVPGPVAPLLGVAGIRGLLVPVYDLAALLGYPTAAQPRWFVLAHAPQPVGVAFGTYEAHWRLPPTSLTRDAGRSAQSGETAYGGGLVRGAVRGRGAQRPLISIPAVLDVITRLVRAQDS